MHSFSKFFVAFFIAVAISSCTIQQRVVEPVYNTHESGIRYKITEQGNGQPISINDVVYVHYKLLLEDSTLIDSSYDRGEPVNFKVGAGQVIPGWEQGIVLLSQGDKARLIIPSELGYGNRQVGEIPANSKLIFDVKIERVNKAPSPLDLAADAEITETTSGLRYAIIEPGRGMMLIPGMKVKIHYTGFFDDMSIFDSSLQREDPIEFTLGKGMVIRGWEEGISKLRVGDKARLWIPYSLAYGEQGRGPIPPRTDLIFDVEVMDAQEIKRPTPYDASGRDTLHTESGLQYIILNEGTGEYPEPGEAVEVHYTGFLTNGNIFDSSVERGQPFRFLLGRGQVIPGWDEGIALMKKGARFRFIIPPELAYGERAAGPIPSNATLIFDVELITID